jgi:hypothetical protein
MLVNPFLVPPQVESPQSRSWGRGLAFGFQSGPTSVVEPSDVQSEDPDAFQQGVLAGQQAAVNGLDIIANPCVDLNAEGPYPEGLPDVSFGTLELGAALTDLGEAFAAGIFGAVVALVDISTGLQTHFDDPDTRLKQSASQLQNLLGSMGITDSMVLFLGGAVDTRQRHCELQFTKVFRFADRALNAARSIGRPTGMTVKWRTDQSGSAEVVDSFESET